MSKVKITGNASGTGVLTIEAPNTNSDRTISLPDSTDTLVGQTTTNSLASDATALTTRVNAVGGRKNLLINGGFDVWQRGTSFTGKTTDEFLADRWEYVDSGCTYNASREAVTLGDSTVPSTIKYFNRFNPTTANNNCGLYQKIEDVQSVPSGTVTFSFYAKGVNPSSSSIEVFLRQDFGSGGSSDVTDTSNTISLTSNWQRFEININVGSLSGKTIGADSYVWVGLRQPAGDTSTTPWTLDITGVQLELGDQATDFEHRSYGEELALCQRYFETSFPTGVTPANGASTSAHHSSAYTICNMVQWAGSGRNISIPFKVTKRASPAMTRYGNSQGYFSYAHVGTSAPNASTAHHFNQHIGLHSVFEHSFSLSNNVSGSPVWGIMGNWTADAEL